METFRAEEGDFILHGGIKCLNGRQEGSMVSFEGEESELSDLMKKRGSEDR